MYVSIFSRPIFIVSSLIANKNR